MFWYHPHHHSSTNQVFKGLYGTILITDPNEDTLIASGVLPPASQTKTLALSDITVCAAVNTRRAAGSCARPTRSTKTANSRLPRSRVHFCPATSRTSRSPARPVRCNEGQIVLTNGRNVGGRAGTPDAPGALDPGAATLDVVAGQGYRFRIGSEATVRFFRLRLTGSDGTNIDSGAARSCRRPGRPAGPRHHRGRHGRRFPLRLRRRRDPARPGRSRGRGRRVSADGDRRVHALDQGFSRAPVRGMPTSRRFRSPTSTSPDPPVPATR